MTHNSHALRVRRQILHAWASTWYRRHERQLASEGVRFPVRVGHSTFSVTTEQALAAVSRTVHELDARLADHPTWGCDRHGRPSELAMRGLINRRLTSRLVDQLRHAGGITTDSLARPIPGASEGGIALGDTISAPSSVEQAEARIWLTQILARESQATREVVIRRVLGEPSHAISLELGLDDAATRQRLSRFKRRHAADLVDVA